MDFVDAAHSFENVVTGASMTPEPVITDRHQPSSLYTKLLVVALLVFMGLLSGGAARRESVTIDEIAHIGAGVSYLQKLDMRMNLEHPPLSKVLAAMPLVVRGTHADYSHVSWSFSGSGMFNQYLGEWVFGHWLLMKWNEPHSTLFWARLPMLLLTLLLGYVLYSLSTRLGGRWAGLLCLAAYVTTPAFLAFGPLAITDVAFALFWILTVWQLPNMWESPKPSQILMFGLAFAGALLSKFSSGLLLFVFIAVPISLRLSSLPDQPFDKLARRKWRRRAWLNVAKGIACAALLVYAVYLILSWNQPTDSFSIIPNFPESHALRRLLMPAWLYLQGLIGFAMSAGSRPTYLLGHSYPHGVWFYFPVIFLLKSQLAFLLLLLLGAITAIATKVKSSVPRMFIPTGFELHWRCLWVSLVVYVVACMLNRLDISIRHFTVALALIILLLSPLPRILRVLHDAYPRAVTTGGRAAAVLVVVCLISVARAYPYFLPYINSLGMGRPGYMLVNDSNLDWDQGFRDAEEFILQRGLSEVLFDQYGFAEPHADVPQARRWNCQTPTASDGGRWAIVSANNIADVRNCLWLMRYPHHELAGGSMYAVELPKIIPAAGQPGGPPMPKDFHFLIGPINELDAREIFVSCIRDPNQLEPTFKRLAAMAEEARRKK
jgi:hypothetical protein